MAVAPTLYTSMQGSFSRYVFSVVAVLAAASFVLPSILAFYVMHVPSSGLAPQWLEGSLKVAMGLQDGEFNWLAEQWQIIPAAVAGLLLSSKRYRNTFLKFLSIVLVILVVFASWQLIEWKSLETDQLRDVAVGLGYTGPEAVIEDVRALFVQVERVRDIALTWVVAALAISIPQMKSSARRT